MEKILVLGDTHGRALWKDIIEKEIPGKIVFLGDYVSTHDNISAEQQISNLEEILSYKEINQDKVILLRGNHDLCELGYYWAECSPNEPKVREVMSQPEFKERFLNLTQWVYVDDTIKTVFSHAGISQVWMDDIAHIQDIHEINNLEPSEAFGFTPNWGGDCYGNSTTQPPTWIRPETLCECNVKGWNQVIGHTPVNQIVNLNTKIKLTQDIWLCDALSNRQYLIIDNGEFQPKTFE